MRDISGCILIQQFAADEEIHMRGLNSLHFYAPPSPFFTTADTYDELYSNVYMCVCV